MSSARRIAYVIVLLTFLASVAGCSSSMDVTYIPEGGSYAFSDLPAVLEAAEMGDAEDLPSDRVDAARQEALASLRTHGEQTALLADALTSQFPVDVHAVPAEIRSVTFEGEPAFLVLEAWGDAGQPLSYRRIWVFAQSDLSLLTAYSLR